MFQSTPAHSGRRRADGDSGCAVPCFNPRPRTAGDFEGGAAWLIPKCFNPRPRTAGDVHTSVAAPVCLGFNPRPRTAGDAIRFPPCEFYSVSIHARAQRATKTPFDQVIAELFQSTPAHSGRPRASVAGGARAGFNPRPRTAGDALQAPAPDGVESFNPRPRTAGDLEATEAMGKLAQFQSTPAHSGRRRHGFARARVCAVSIHARAQRATEARVDLLQRGVVSIHARAQRATCMTASFRYLQYGFNPRPRTAGDGAACHRRRTSRRFNPRPRTAGDGADFGPENLLWRFQSTPAHSGRRKSASSWSGMDSFNPRPRTAGDARSRAKNESDSVSIHARAQRATASSFTV